MTETRDHRCYDRLFIGGHWREPSTRNRIAVISPHSEEPIGEAPPGSDRNRGERYATRDIADCVDSCDVRCLEIVGSDKAAAT